jgi:hypothetical protein
MKHNKSSHHSDHQSPSGPPTTADLDRHQAGVDFAPSADEVARRAYFSYLNQGSLPGHDVQHWLDAEAHLYEERKLNRGHLSHSPR